MEKDRGAAGYLPNIRPNYPINDFCEQFGFGRSFVYAEIRAGRLNAFKIGPRTCIAGDDAVAWLNSYRNRAA